MCLDIVVLTQAMPGQHPHIAFSLGTTAEKVGQNSSWDGCTPHVGAHSHLVTRILERNKHWSQ